MKNNNGHSPRRFRCVLGVILVTVVAVMMTVAAGAAEPTVSEIYSGFTVTPRQDNTDILDLTYSANELTAGNHYLVMMLNGTAESHPIAPDTILYIDQATAETKDGNTTISFAVYPSVMKSGVICLFGMCGDTAREIIIAEVSADPLKGDIDLDDDVDVQDAILLFDHYMKGTELPSSYTESLDFDGNGTSNVEDAKYLFRSIVLSELYPLKNR